MWGKRLCSKRAWPLPSWLVCSFPIKMKRPCEIWTMRHPRRTGFTAQGSRARSTTLQATDDEGQTWETDQLRFLRPPAFAGLGWAVRDTWSTSGGNRDWSWAAFEAAETQPYILVFLPGMMQGRWRSALGQARYPCLSCDFSRAETILWMRFIALRGTWASEGECKESAGTWSQATLS